MMLFGIVAFGFHLSLIHSVQQIAAEAARAAVAGLTDGERSLLAQANIGTNAPSYPMITPTKLSVVSTATDPLTNTFTVSVRYDARDLVIYSLPIVAMPSPIILRSAAIKRGGY